MAISFAQPASRSIAGTRSRCAPSALARPSRTVARVRCQSASAAVTTETRTFVRDIAASDLNEAIASCSQLIVLDVFTLWCGPCKMIAPELEKMAGSEEFKDVAFFKLDCTSNADNKKWAMDQKVKALPTFILFKDGKRVTDMTGSKAAALRSLIQAHL